MSVFLEIPSDDWIADNDLAFAVRDRFPVSRGHALIVTRRVVSTWWDASHEEQRAILELVEQVRRRLDVEFSPDGYNIGINAGTAAGQTVDHLHVHVIPRFDGDVSDPRGGVRNVIPSLGNYLADTAAPSPVRSSLITPLNGRMRLELMRCLINDELDRIDLLVSFVKRSGIDIIAKRVDEALERGAQIRVLTTDYLQITDAGALGFFLDRLGASEAGGSLEVRVFSDASTSFHPKAYLFSSAKDRRGVAFVGSSNLSRSALETGVEWNVETREVAPLLDEFEVLWQDPRSTPLTGEWLTAYGIEQQRRLDAQEPLTEEMDEPPEPLPEPWGVQAEGMAALTATRLEGNGSGMVVMATGLGKTWLAAFDSTRPEFRRTLFVAHRDEILDQARDVFRRIMPSRRFARFSGGERELDGDVVFASVQSLHRHLDGLDPESFDYVVVDEFHHADAPTYRKLIAHLRPKFLLGLTATPDRSDAADLLALCSDNLVFECGLVEGVSRGLLSPFAYQAIRDVADYAEIPWRSGRFDPGELTQRLETDQRAQQVHDEWTAVGGAVRQTIGFCCSITHAEFMAEFFRARGVAALAVHSGPTSAPRAETLERFRAGDVRAIFTVDLFNEGVDVPCIEVVLLLRPTESPIVFFQQLGRGLRRAAGKERLDVVDLVGNHRGFLLKARLLAGLGGRQTVTSRKAVEMLDAGVGDLPPGCSVIVAPEVIDLLRQLAGPARADELLDELLEHWRAAHGEQRPTALELSLVSGKAHQAKPQGGWFGALERRDLLTPQEAETYRLAADFLIEIEHGSYTRSYKLITLHVLLDSGQFRRGMSTHEIAVSARWRLDRDPRLRRDLVDARSGFRDPGEPTPAEWDAYWRKNPIASLTRANRATGQAWFTETEARLHSSLDLPDRLWPTLEAMAAELVEYRLHRYLVSRGSRRSGEHRRVHGPDGVEVNAGFVVESEGGSPVAVYVESAGGAKGTKAERNSDYVAGLDLLLERMRRLGLVVQDAYLDTTSTSELAVPDRRLSLGEAHRLPVTLREVEDLGAMRTALLRSMASTGRTSSAKGGGNQRKSFRLVISGETTGTATELADALASGRFEDPEVGSPPEWTARGIAAPRSS